MGINQSVFKSFSFAANGVKRAFREEPNFKIHTVIAAVVVILAAFLGFSAVEWVVLILTIFLVAASEMVNTAVEDTLNLVSPELNEKVGAIKDLMAAIVLLAAIAAVAVGALLFLPKILALF